jgi:hypothetical protein
MSCLGQSRRCAILDGALSGLVTRLATSEAGKGCATCGGGRSGPPRANTLSGAARSGMTLSGAVVVGGVGTTSMAPRCRKSGAKEAHEHVASEGLGHERNS